MIGEHPAILAGVCTTPTEAAELDAAARAVGCDQGELIGAVGRPSFSALFSDPWDRARAAIVRAQEWIVGSRLVAAGEYATAQRRAVAVIGCGCPTCVLCHLGRAPVDCSGAAWEDQP